MPSALRARNALSVAGATATRRTASVGAAVAAVVFGIDLREGAATARLRGQFLDCLLASPFETTDAAIQSATVTATTT